MAISFDACSGGNDTNLDTVKTWTHTCAANATKLIVFFTLRTNGTASPTVGTVTYDGVAMTQILTQDCVGVDANMRSYGFYLDSPASGANTVQVTTNSNAWLVGVSLSYIGVVGGAARDSTSGCVLATNSGTHSVTTVSGDQVVDYYVQCANSGQFRTLTPGTGQTERGEYTNNAGDGRGDMRAAASTKTATGASTGMYYMIDVSRYTGHLVVSLKPLLAGNRAYFIG